MMKSESNLLLVTQVGSLPSAASYTAIPNTSSPFLDSKPQRNLHYTFLVRGKRNMTAAVKYTKGCAATDDCTLCRQKCLTWEYLQEGRSGFNTENFPTIRNN